MRNMSEFSNETDPVEGDFVIGYRTPQTGGERRFTLANLSKYFGIVTSWLSTGISEGQVATADGTGGVEWRDPSGLGAGTDQEVVYADDTGALQRSGTVFTDLETTAGAQAKANAAAIKFSLVLGG